MFSWLCSVYILVGVRIIFLIMFYLFEKKAIIDFFFLIIIFPCFCLSLVTFVFYIVSLFTKGGWQFLAFFMSVLCHLLKKIRFAWCLRQCLKDLDAKKNTLWDKLFKETISFVHPFVYLYFVYRYLYLYF